MTELDLKYTPQPKQARLHRSRANEILYGGAAGPGKVVLDDAYVLTPWGWKQGKDLSIGDVLLNPDGSRQSIIVISDHITAPGYTVTMHDGAQTTVMEGHLWLSWRSGKRVKSTVNSMFGISSAKIVTTGQLKMWTDTAKDSASKGRRPNWPLIPICESLHFERVTNKNAKVDIDPYLLGLLLGDGHISNGQVAITSNDHDHIKETLEGYQYAKADKTGTDAIQYIFREESYSGLRSQLEQVGLYGKLAHEKAIPEQYLWASIDDRLAILQGLMDSDGTADARGGWASFCSVSKELADGVAFLVFSLGGVARIMSKNPFYTAANGDRKEGREAYNVYIKFPSELDLFRLPRKLALSGKCPATPLYRRVVDVAVGEPVSGRCITVDNVNGLYITDGFIVTHNSHALRFEALIWAMRIPGIHVYLFRRTYPELEKNHILPSRFQYPKELGEYKLGDRRWEFKNGSMIHFCHCQYDSDVFMYQGAEIDLLLIDELTTFTEFQYDYLRGRVRPTRDIPDEYRHKIPGIVCASNPGGIGHQFAKQRWVDFIGGEGVKRAPGRQGGMLRAYIPGLLDDNPILMDRDPDYIYRLDALPEPYRTAYKEGSWDIFMGQMFNFARAHHVVKPLPIPDYAPLWWTFDWGYGAPFACLWYWIDADNRIYVCGEDYGWNGMPNQGLRLSDSELAQRIKEREGQLGLQGRQITRLAGPDSFNKKPDYKGGGQGPSTAEVFASHGIHMAPGDPSRILKIRQVHERLRLFDDMAPMIQVYDTCEHLIRTFPLLQADEHNVEDVDTDGEDHLYDALALMCMARPISLKEPKLRKSEWAKRIDELEAPHRKGTLADHLAFEQEAYLKEMGADGAVFGQMDEYVDTGELIGTV